jgi:peptide/nickel transport system substrate-binding protein
VTRRRWLLAALLGIFAAAAIGWTLLAPRDTAGPAPTARSAMGEPSRGGSLVATLRTEPKTFNRYTGNGFPTHLIATLTQARLVRINNATSELEPWLAERWTISDDRRTYTLNLRESARFSDGAPFTAADVLFSFAAVYDSKTASPLADSLRVNGKPLEVRAISPSVVALTFPEPYGPGLRMLDNLPIYPRHRLAGALADGSFGTAWGPQTPPGEMAGLGPFVLTQYDPGQRLAFARNPHYWRRDAAGRTLPFLDRLTLEIVPDQNAEVLRMQAGGLDVMQGEMRPEDYLPLKREADAGRLRVLDVGASLSQHLLWFNLGTPRPASGWLRAPEFRQALSAAVDRAAVAPTVYHGAATPRGSRRRWSGRPTIPIAPARCWPASALLTRATAAG